MYLRIGNVIYTVGKQVLKKLSREVGPVSKNKYIDVVGDVSKGEQTSATEKMSKIRQKTHKALPKDKQFTATSKEFQEEFNKQYMKDVKNSLSKAREAEFLETQLMEGTIEGVSASKLIGKGSGKEEVAKEILRKFLRSGDRKMKKGGRVGKPKGVGAAMRGYGATKRGN
tara:strand:- start:36 stop:545 length:510 start_codon:yes stop_codon:yes gene_type:complete